MSDVVYQLNTLHELSYRNLHTSWLTLNFFSLFLCVEIVLYELFSAESNRDSGRMDSIKLLPLSDFKKSALLNTFEVDTKGKDIFSACDNFLMNFSIVI